MRWLALFLLLAVAVPVVEGHGRDDDSFGQGHIGHTKVVRVEGYLIDDSATITVAGKTISGKFSIPMKMSDDDFSDLEDYAWDSALPEPFYETIGENECYYDYEPSDALGSATFAYGGQTITLKDFPIDMLPYYSDEEQKGLRLKIFYSYKEHGKDPVERFAWTEC